MRPDHTPTDTYDPTGCSRAGPGTVDAEPDTRLKLASAVMFVADLDRSAGFYRELLGWEVTVRDNTVALLVSPDGFQLYLRDKGSHASHPLGHIGPQYLMWTADSEDDLRRCVRLLRARSAHVTTTSGDGFTVVEGHDPDHVPVLVTYPGPDHAPRHQIMQRIYTW
jgi:catechol 2,3-dioxygenase-like lactoylglutathione lyase family enzyme